MKKTFWICNIRYIFSLPRYILRPNILCSMGSPLPLVLANLFMVCYETLWLNTFLECDIILYRRYVDDIMRFLNCESDIKKKIWIFKYTASLHQIYIWKIFFVFKCPSHKWWRLILHFGFLQRNCDWLIY